MERRGSKRDLGRAFCSSSSAASEKGPWIGLVIQAVGNYNRRWLSGRLFMRYLCIRPKVRAGRTRPDGRYARTREDACYYTWVSRTRKNDRLIERKRKTKIEYPRGNEARATPSQGSRVHRFSSLERESFAWTGKLFPSAFDSIFNYSPPLSKPSIIQVRSYLPPALGEFGLSDVLSVVPLKIPLSDRTRRENKLCIPSVWVIYEYTSGTRILCNRIISLNTVLSLVVNL